MNYSYPLYRPPSEANSLILQITEGCSFNRCSFCSMYRDKTFSEKPLERVLDDIQLAIQLQPNTRRVFLADGDALYRDMDTLLKILDVLYKSFPNLERVSSYALPNNLLTKTSEELLALNKAGLTLLYYGVETGSAALLKCITKGSTPSKMTAGLQKALDAGMNVSATVILGLGGKHHWREHIEQTAELVNALNLTYLSTLQLTLDDVIKEEFIQKFHRQNREYVPQSDDDILQEQALLISLISPKKSVTFRSNHASNALPLKGVLPQDKEILLTQLRSATHGESQLVPTWLRGL
ncbi:MAG: radical SAM protein [Cycloclasticus sp. symbiont of Bathymodiolus heckerae]|nr:MAG: radical SAM protein [Cycloclasticus sp. symbiont of Bathymodiolus heckerae]